MNRRQFTLMTGAAAWPSAVRAQSSPRKLRVGGVSGQPRSSILWTSFVARMAQLGYREGENFLFDLVKADSTEDYRQGYKRFAGGAVDIIVAPGPEVSLQSALAVPGDTPIVMVAIDYDPLARGYIKSLARPEGRVTGLMMQQIELAVKRVQLLKDAFPDLKAITVFWDQISRDQWAAIQAAAVKIGIGLAGVELSNPPYDYEKAFASAPAEARGALLPLTSPFIFREAGKIADLALRHRSILMWSNREMADAGGLLTYGTSFPAIFARVADFVDRIAKGARPGDLPVEQPTKFELVVNARTARAIGVTLPPVLLARADEVID
ncbi:MAG: ABC transporter substrate-binding protein [Reyranellales bacterium]